MKILVLADAESTYIWDHFDPEAFAGVDLVISCGDLKASYLLLSLCCRFPCFMYRAIMIRIICVIRPSDAT